VGYRSTPSTCDVRGVYVHERPRAQNALSSRVFVVKVPLSLAMRAAHVISAWCVRSTCLLGTSSVQLSKKCTEIRQTLPSTYVLPQTYKTI